MDSKNVAILGIVIVVVLIFVWNDTVQISNPPPILVHYSCTDFSDNISISGNTLIKGQSSCYIQKTTYDSQSGPTFSDKDKQIFLTMNEKIFLGNQCDEAVRVLIEDEYDAAFVDSENKVYLCRGLSGT